MEIGCGKEGKYYIYNIINTRTQFEYTGKKNLELQLQLNI